MSEACPFCDLSQIPSPIVVYGNVMVFTPLNPVAPGHRLVVPREHVADFAVDPRVSADVMAVASLLAHEAGGAFNVITSRGAEATQSVTHLHLHLIPRSEGDALKLPWTPPQGHSGRREAMNWQPIWTAPKDGTTVMLWNGPKARYKIVTGRFHSTAFGWQSSPGGWPCTPKAWAPLPAPPDNQ